MAAKPIPHSKLPRRHYYPAAICNADFDAAAARLGAEPKRLFLKEGRGWYNEFAVELNTGRYATLTQWEDFPHSIEIGIELVGDLLFYEDDLQDILAVLDVDIKDTSRAQAYFRWKKDTRHTDNAADKG